jgi:hypothetical protein
MTVKNLPVAVETIVTIVETAAAIMAPIGNPEHAIHRTDGAADTGADRAANHATDRAGNPVTFIGAFLRATHDTLCMDELGDREQRQGDGRNGKTEPDGQTGGQSRSLDLRFHLNLNSLMVGGDCADGAGIFNVDVAKRLRNHDEIRSGQRNNAGKEGSIIKASFPGDSGGPSRHGESRPDKTPPPPCLRPPPN